MLPRPEHDALLLITHPGGARSIDYDDYWDGEDLIYTGRGKIGDQRLEGANRDVAENRRALLAFERAGSRQLRFLGRAHCSDHWEAWAPDQDGRERRVLRFRLQFSGAGPPPRRRKGAIGHSSPVRRPRPFDKRRPPSSRQGRGHKGTPEETLALQEKAAQGHHQILALLSEWLEAGGWTSVEEIPAAVDLWATGRDRQRVIFEAKTLSGKNEVHQLRAALAQLLEYRFRYGKSEDKLCVVTDGPVGDLRARFLDALDIAVVRVHRGTVLAGSARASQWFTGLGSEPVGSP
jgi:hypothetical protein